MHFSIPYSSDRNSITKMTETEIPSRSDDNLLTESELKKLLNGDSCGRMCVNAPERDFRIFPAEQSSG